MALLFSEFTTYVGRGNFKEVARLLELDRNRCFSEEQQGSWKAIHIAASLGNVKMLKLLVQYGVDVNEKNAYGLSAFDIAISREQTAFCEALLEAGVVLIPKMLSKAAAEGCPDIVELLLCRGATSMVNVQNPKGNTPLHKASECGYLGIVRTLILHGASTLILNNAGESVYDVAGAVMPHKRVDTIKVLLSNTVVVSVLFFVVCY